MTVAPLMLGFCVSLAGFLMLWPLSLRWRDSSVADLWWGPGFAGFLWTAWAAGGMPDAPRDWTLLWLTGLWSARMAWTLGARRMEAEGEDPRYASLRAAAGESWPTRSLFQVFVLQGLLQGLLILPAACALGSDAAAGPLFALGLAAAAAGLSLETVADMQLDRWRRRGGAGVMRQGLRRLTRHPNYGGEVIFWSGVALIAVDAGVAWAPLAPLGLALLLDRVSGRPPLEERLERHPGWRAYAAQTPPWIPRRAAVLDALRARTGRSGSASHGGR